MSYRLILPRMPQYVPEPLLDGRLVSAVFRRVTEHHAREAEEGAILLARNVPRHELLRRMEVWNQDAYFNS